MKFYTLEKIAKQLVDVRAAVVREAMPLPTFKFTEDDAPGAEAPNFDDAAWADFAVGGYWGGYDTVAWFRTTLTVPEGWRSHKLALRFLVGPRDEGETTAETMLYVDGVALQGLDVWHETAWLPPELKERGTLRLALRSWSGTWHPPARRQFKLAQLEVIDEPTEALYYLADTVHKALKVLGPNDLRREQMLTALNNTFLRLDFTEPQSAAFYHSAAEAHDYLAACVQAWQAHEEIKPRVTAIGHSHIDLAWLWRWTHTREKAQRTFATVLHLMRQYPEYRFMHSSPHLYKALQQDSPELFARVQARIAAGDWEITGGMWVESDTNVPNGESLVRQFLLGKAYIRDTFGRETNILWLPDVFGYSAALPQIIKGAGLQYFMTTKISWSQTNRFPYDTFLWRGIDGTEVLTHFVTTPDSNEYFYTYNGKLEPNDVQGLWNAYRQKDVNDELLHLFGWGDGGGGPTQEMLETARGLKNLPGMPALEQGLSEPFFARLAERVADQALPTWDGELYLELHRGTYTSQAFNKRSNRKSELLYHTAEWLAALAGLTLAAPYPHAELRRGWELLLFNQFHDILPGSSIPQVYVDARQDYAEIARIGEAAAAEARAALVAQVAAKQPSVVVFNPLGWERQGVVALPADPGLNGLSLSGAVQAVTGQNGEPQWLAEVPSAVPALGYRAVALETAVPPETDAALTVTPERVENQYYRITLDAHGHLTGLFDKRAGREVLPAGARANVLQAFEDKPMNFDAWDIDLYYQEKLREVDDLIEVAVEESGPVRCTLRLVWRFHKSTITQRLSLYAYSARIDFRTEVDWHERQVLLKVAFPVAVRATRATYDIQFGSVERPTHWNTSWDWARFEVIGHKWVDLSEGGYGVALLNDCKYGHDVKDNVLRLTLLRSAIDPDPLADEGVHHFTYSLLPHAGDWREGGVVREAYSLNQPLQAARVPAQAGALPASFGLAACDAEHVVIETVKQAEGDSGAWVFRVFECHQTRATAVNLTFGRAVRDIKECNLVEEDERPAQFEGTTLTFPIRPFEIKTFKVWFEAGMTELILAFDFGGTKHTAGLIGRGETTFRAQQQVTSPPGADGDYDIRTMLAMGHALLSGARPAAVGVSFGGPVDYATGTVLLSHHVPGWENRPLRQIVEAEFGAPANVDNDANVAAVGEHRFGAGRGCSSLLYITVSTGVGGGWILDNRPWRGRDSMAGEFGHLMVDPLGPPCVCGSHGCVERMAAGPHIAARAREWLVAQPERGAILRRLVNNNLAAIDGKAVAQAAAEGDELAWEALAVSARALGQGIGSVANVMNPERFVLGGGTTKSGERYWETIRATVRACAMPEVNFEIVPAGLGDFAPLWGAVAIADQEGKLMATTRKTVRSLLSAKIIKELATPANLRYGQAIYRRRGVKIIKAEANSVEGRVGGLEGTSAEGGGQRRRVRLSATTKGLAWHCAGNPKNHQIFCKHCCALALAILRRAK